MKKPDSLKVNNYCDLNPFQLRNINGGIIGALVSTLVFIGLQAAYEAGKAHGHADSQERNKN